MTASPNVLKAQSAFAAGQPENARNILEAASTEGDAAAGYSLAVALAYGQGGEIDLIRAADILAQIHETVPAAASLHRFALVHNWRSDTGWEDAVEHLIDSARKGNPSAQRECGLLCLISGNPDIATGLLLKASKAGDPAAAMALLRLGFDEDDNESWARRAREGLSRSRHPLAGELTAIAASQKSPVHSESPPDWLRIKPILCDWTPEPAESSTLIEDIAAVGFPAILPEAVCDYVLTTGLRQLKPSTIMDETTGQTVEDPHRQSLSMTFAPHLQDMVHIAVERVMAAMAGIPAGQTERVNLLFYRPGEHYKPHVDYFSPDDAANSDELKRAGQRIATSLICLHPASAGGATSFPRFDTSWQGKTGDGFTFRNTRADGEVEPLTLHQGDVVTEGWKALASLWIRERPSLPG